MDPLESYLADHDEPCPKCGYNLRGLRGKVCPECGAPIDLDAILAPLRRALRQRLLVGRAAAAVSFALGATMMVGRSRDVIAGRGAQTGWIGIATGFGLFALSILWLCFAARISERPLWQQSTIATGMWAAVVIAILITFN
jgi:hypothetical protein